MASVDDESKITSGDEQPEVFERGIALLGNGDGKPLDMDQIHLIEEMFQWAVTHEKSATEDSVKSAGCDRETCRRFLVARKWDIEAAKAQFLTRIQWQQSASGKFFATHEFWQSPKALKDPLALCMRLIGWDIEGRPIVYGNFTHANDRWDVEASMAHLTLLLEACCDVLTKRQKKGLNKTASSRQWIWVLDFDGFGLRDQNPKTGLKTTKLMNWYPEMMHRAILLNAPFLFSATWKILNPLLDNRIRDKILFCSDKAMSKDLTLKKRLGDEAFDYILAEVGDNYDRKYENPPKQYWAPPTNTGAHDSRGMKSYIDSEFYVKTPGDVWQEQQN